MPAALDGLLPDGQPIVVHLSGLLPGDVWLVEPRQPSDGATAPLTLAAPVTIDLLGGGQVRLLDHFEDSQRLWLARLAIDEDVLAYAAQHGRPIRYRHVGRDWPLARYQTVFGREPGSVEMPSASRPFTDELVTNLITRGVQIAPLLLHTGVSSLEGGEAPYPERYHVPPSTAAEINDDTRTRRSGHRDRHHGRAGRRHCHRRPRHGASRLRAGPRSSCRPTTRCVRSTDC